MIDVTGETAFIDAVTERVRTFAATRDCETPALRVTLASGDNFLVASMEPQPGGGMVTLAPIPEDEAEMVLSAPGRWVTPTALIVRISEIRVMEILAERPERARFGFRVADPGA